MTFTESDSVELKAEIIPDICKEIIAFANTRGGTLYIGVQDDGTVIGIENVDQTILQLNNKIRDSIKPDLTMFIRYDVQHMEGKSILAVTIQKGTDRPYYLSAKGLKSSGVYVRNGTSCDPASDTAIRRMIKDTDGDCYESMRSLEQELTFTAASKQFLKRNLPFDKAKMRSMDLISNDGIYRNTAMLVSDQCTSTIKAAVFAGTDKGSFLDRVEFTGSLFQQMEDLYTYLNLRNQKKSIIEGLYRTDLRDYPEEALREALLNTIIHRDYSIKASTLVSVYNDRIEFVSAGGLADGIELNDILLGLSICRNPKLASIFYRLELIEAYGTGIPKIMNAYADCTVKPQIEVTNNAFKITLPNRNYAQQNSRTVINEHSYEYRILEYLKTHGQASRTEIDRLLGVSQSTASRILKRMIQNGLIYQEGNGRTSHYKQK